ncbi:MAG: MBL fold metallo-hydrolase [bacterium]
MTAQNPPFQVQIVPVTPFQQNCSIIRAHNGQAAIIDPGGDTDKLLKVADEMDAQIEKIWLTHGHLDHAGETMLMKEKTGALIEGPARPDAFWLDQIETHAANYNFPGVNKNVTPDRWLDDGDLLELADIKFKVLTSPGHTPGHVVIYHPDMKIAFVGDVLFQGSIGRTDFPMSNHQDLLDSITKKLWPLGDDMSFVPGHGPVSTFGQERQSNPFVSDAALQK